MDINKLPQLQYSLLSFTEPDLLYKYVTIQCILHFLAACYVLIIVIYIIILSGGKIWSTMKNTQEKSSDN